MISIFSRKKTTPDKQEVVEIVAEVPAGEFPLPGGASHMSHFLYNRILEGMAQRYIEMNYNETVAALKPQTLAMEIQRQAAIIIAQKMVQQMIESLRH